MQNTEMCGVMNRSFSHLKKIHILDTIYGLSTGQSTKAGIAIIRVSGLESFHCLTKLISNQTKPKPRYTSLRRIICPKTSEILDKAIVVWIPGPSSYTGEDLVEFHVHGSRAVLQGIFSAFEHLNQDSSSKIRPAEAGEFTRRAFENGKMDLTEIEGLGDLLSAETSAQRKQALRQMEGHMREIFEAWR
jgi:tRNA modification GTPase